MRSRGGGGILARRALIHKGHLDHGARDGLDLFGQNSHLGAILIVGRSHREGKQLTKGSDSKVDRAALAAFGAIIAGPCATLGTGLQGTTVQNSSTRIGRARPVRASASGGREPWSGRRLR